MRNYFNRPLAQLAVERVRQPDTIVDVDGEGGDGEMSVGLGLGRRDGNLDNMPVTRYPVV